ncbi:MAG: PIG-L family deacetylase [Anaerolineae bacterium]|nr:PIG-L family deacetylase [Anaerolineae bacterium]
MAKRRLLICYAHPDDESFGNGALIAKYIHEGAEVYYLCATDGDVGTIPDDMKDQYETIRELRLAELACAEKTLGFKLIRMGYKDSGMQGAPENDDPDCLVYNWKHNPEDVKRRVVETIREVQPQVIITFNKYGGYGHPDHIAIQQATIQAFHAASDSAYLTDGLQPYTPQKLYYSTMPKWILSFRLWWLKMRGEDVRHMGRNKDIDFQKIVDNIEPAHVSVNIGAYLEDWDEASACHISQGGGSMRGFFARWPMWLRRVVMGKQGLTRVFPEPVSEGISEHDLFENVTLDEPQKEPVS